MSFIGFLKSIGKDFEKGLAWAVKYAVPVEKLVGLLFPAAAPAALGVADATSLIQTGVQSGTGAQKLAEVLLLTEGSVTALLAQAGITADTSYVTNLVNAVVAILNVQSAPTA